jgi:hypothetical protein
MVTYATNSVSEPAASADSPHPRAAFQYPDAELVPQGHGEQHLKAAVRRVGIADRRSRQKTSMTRGVLDAPATLAVTWPAA